MTNPEDVGPLVEQVRPLLAGQASELQGAVLADLLAIWLAGHHVPGDVRATRDVRADLLAHHVHWVRKLVPVNAGLLGTTP
jgi:hypothetical protein